MRTMPDVIKGTAKIGVIGDVNSVLCFKAFGMDVFPVVEAEAEDNRKLLDRLAREGYGLIFITEQAAEPIGETINRYDKAMTPAIILIPSNAGSLGVGLARIRKNVEKAVGINILD